jgi:hypothetical protein
MTDSGLPTKANQIKKPKEALKLTFLVPWKCSLPASQKRSILNHFDAAMQCSNGDESNFISEKEVRQAINHAIYGI